MMMFCYLFLQNLTIICEAGYKRALKVILQITEKWEPRKILGENN